jgi:hypothetical protein
MHLSATSGAVLMIADDRLVKHRDFLQNPTVPDPSSNSLDCRLALVFDLALASCFAGTVWARVVEVIFDSSLGNGFADATSARLVGETCNVMIRVCFFDAILAEAARAILKLSLDDDCLQKLALYTFSMARASSSKTVSSRFISTTELSLMAK